MSIVLKNFTTEELKAEVQRREDREKILKELTWKNVLNIGAKAATEWVQLQECAKHAVKLGYKYFVIDTYPHLYAVDNKQWCGYQEVKFASVCDVK